MTNVNEVLYEGEQNGQRKINNLIDAIMTLASSLDAEEAPVRLLIHADGKRMAVLGDPGNGNYWEGRGPDWILALEALASEMEKYLTRELQATKARSDQLTKAHAGFRMLCKNGSILDAPTKVDYLADK